MISARAVFESAAGKQDRHTMERALAAARKIDSRRAIVAAAHPQPTVSTRVVRSRAVVQPALPSNLDGRERCSICRLSYVDADERRRLVRVRVGAALILACPSCVQRNAGRLVPA
jgi:hypothetical protein